MSKFDKLFEARAGGEQEEPNRPSVKESPKSEKPSKKSGKSDVKKVVGISTPEVGTSPTSEPAKQRGRPKAKRSDPDFVGFTTYIRRDTHLKAKIALLQEGRNRELSELVELLLLDWLKANG